MSASFCVICQRETDGSYLDAACFSRLAGMLREIEDQSAELDTRPSMAQPTGPGGGSLASHRAPANLDAIVARDPRRGLMRWGSDDFDPWGLDDTASVLETLHSRAQTVYEESGVVPPSIATISGERDYLTRNLPWIAQQPWVDEFFNEMKELLGQLQRTNKTRPDKPVGFCHLPRGESTCGGRIWQREQERMIWRQAEAGGDRCVRIKVKVNDGPAYCERCRATWDDPKELKRLHLIEEQRQAEKLRPKTSDGRRMLTVAELAAKHQKTENAIRLRLSKAGARAVRGHYDPAALEQERKSCA